MNKISVSINETISIIKEKLDNNGEVVFTVTGNSMLPFLKDKETLVTLIKPYRPLKRGDVVFYHDEKNRWILHRIIKVKKEILIICGDALNRIEYINPNWVIGIMKSYQYKDKITSCNSKRYKLISAIWMMLRPFRRYILGFIKRLRRKNEHDG